MPEPQPIPGEAFEVRVGDGEPNEPSVDVLDALAELLLSARVKKEDGDA